MNYGKELFAASMSNVLVTEVAVEDKLLYRSKPSPEFVEVYLHAHKTLLGYELGIRLRFYGKKRSKNTCRQVIDFFLPIGYKMCRFFETMDAIIQDDPFEAYFRKQQHLMRAKRRKEFLSLSEDGIATLREECHNRYVEKLDSLGTSGPLWTGYSKFKAVPNKNVKGERLVISYIPMRGGEKSRKPWCLYITKAKWGSREYEITKADQSKLNEQMDSDKCKLYLSTEQLAEMTVKINEAVKETLEKYE